MTKSSMAFLNLSIRTEARPACFKLCNSATSFLPSTSHSKSSCDSSPCASSFVHRWRSAFETSRNSFTSVTASSLNPFSVFFASSLTPSSMASEKLSKFDIFISPARYSSGLISPLSRPIIWSNPKETFPLASFTNVGESVPLSFHRTKKPPKRLRLGSFMMDHCLVIILFLGRPFAYS